MQEWIFTSCPAPSRIASSFDSRRRAASPPARLGGGLPREVFVGAAVGGAGLLLLVLFQLGLGDL